MIASSAIIRIYSVGVWNSVLIIVKLSCRKLEFTPLEFETKIGFDVDSGKIKLEFTPLEFETEHPQDIQNRKDFD